MTTTAFDSFATFVHLHADGATTTAPRTPAFWRDLVAEAGDRVVGAVHGRDAATFHPDESEMHPHGDELLCLLSGAVDVTLEEPAADREVPLRAGELFVVPRGVWHRIVLREPADLLFITPPQGTQLRRARGR
ncbi:MAG TPA: cupin domain-containing protein [Methylomirabilota bacterium]|jgi:mannose-6-phosphate isomerase-like protein (cupin superfamily)